MKCIFFNNRSNLHRIARACLHSGRCYQNYLRCLQQFAALLNLLRRSYVLRRGEIARVAWLQMTLRSDLKLFCPFSQTISLAYLLLNSANLSISSEVTQAKANWGFHIPNTVIQKLLITSIWPLLCLKWDSNLNDAQFLDQCILETYFELFKCISL